MKKLISGLVLFGLIFSSPVLMDHARDIYLQEIVRPKAMPVKVEYRGTVASSFQIKYQGKRLTVTNNHVCSIVETLQRRKAREKVRANKQVMIDSGVPAGLANIMTQMALKVVNTMSFPIVGETLKIGDLNRKILYNSPNHDICFLEPVGDKYFRLASSVHIGERVSIVGHPRGLLQSVSDGRIVGEEIGLFRWLPKAGMIRIYRTTALSYPGNSGSPVINRYGNVVGILFSGYPVDYVNIGGVVPLDVLQTELLTYINE